MTHLKFLLTSSLLAVGLSLSACSAPQSGSEGSSALTAEYDATKVSVKEQRQQISKNWQYLENPVKDIAAANAMEDWTSVDLPHTWNADDTTDVITGYRRDASWYRKQLNLTPEAGKRYFLHFEAAQMKASVYVNGKKSGDHVGGYTAFDIEITEQVKDGVNDVLVRVDNGVDFDLIPSQKADFFQYGGLTRDVFVVTRPTTYLEQVRVNTDVNAERAIVTFNPFVDGSGDFGPATYSTVVKGPDGEIVSKSDASEITLENPQLWSPDTPNIIASQLR